MTSRDRKEVPLRSALVFQCCRFAPLFPISKLPRQISPFAMFIIKNRSAYFHLSSSSKQSNREEMMTVEIKTSTVMILTFYLLIISKLIRGQVKWTVVSLSLACLRLGRLPQNVKQELCWGNCGLHFGVFIYVFVIFDRVDFVRQNTANGVPLPCRLLPTTKLAIYRFLHFERIVEFFHFHLSFMKFNFT